MPPTGSAEVLYLTPTGGLSATPGDGSTASFVADPEDPSPTIGGQTLLGSYLHGPQPQDEVIARGDNLVYVSDPLSAPLTIAGPVALSLEAATSGLDTDFAVRLTVVSPDGSHLLVGEGIRRLKLRDSVVTPSAVIPDTPYVVPVLLTNHHGFRFLPGDRIGLIITSSNFSRFDVNPNSGDDFMGAGVIPQVATNTIYHGELSSITFHVSF